MITAVANHVGKRRRGRDCIVRASCNNLFLHPSVFLTLCGLPGTRRGWLVCRLFTQATLHTPLIRLFERQESVEGSPRNVSLDVYCSCYSSCLANAISFQTSLIELERKPPFSNSRMGRQPIPIADVVSLDRCGSDACSVYSQCLNPVSSSRGT